MTRKGRGGRREASNYGGKRITPNKTRGSRASRNKSRSGFSRLTWSKLGKKRLTGQRMPSRSMKDTRAPSSICPQCNKNKLPWFAVCRDCHLGAQQKKQNWITSKMEILKSGDSKKVQKKRGYTPRGVKSEIEESIERNKGDPYKAWRDTQTKEDKQKLLSWMRLRKEHDLSKRVRKKLPSLSKDDRNDVLTLIREIEKMGEMEMNTVIYHHAKNSDRKIIGDRKVKSTIDRQRAYSSLLQKVNYFTTQERRYPRIYVGTPSAIKAIGSNLAIELKKQGYNNKDTKKLVGKMYNRRVMGNEVQWFYKSEEAHQDLSVLKKESRRILIERRGMTPSQASSRLGEFQNNYGNYMVNYKPGSITLRKFIKALTLESKEDRVAALGSMVEKDLDFHTQKILHRATSGGLPLSEHPKQFLYQFPFISQKKNHALYRNTYRKMFKKAMKDYEPLIKSGRMKEEHARREAGEIADKRAKAYVPSALSYRDSAGNNVVHFALNVKGLVGDKNRVLLPDDDKRLKKFHQIIKDAVETHGSVYYESSVDTKRKDHVHVLIDLNPNTKLRKIVKRVKRNSKNYMDVNVKRGFKWSEGYGFKGAGSGTRIMQNVLNYLRRQEKAGKKKVPIDDVEGVVLDPHGRDPQFISEKRNAYEIQKGNCSGCGDILGQYEGHHKLPRSSGGGHRDNIEALCKECHRKAHKKGIPKVN